MVYSRTTGAPSKKTDYVVVGESAGPKKLETIKTLGLKTLTEDEFLDMIATREGHLDEATKKKMEKAEEQIKKDAKEMEKREKEAAKEAKAKSKAQAGGEHSSSKMKTIIDPSSQLWTTKYAPQTLKEICGNKGLVEKLSNWLRNWYVQHRRFVSRVCSEYLLFLATREQAHREGFKKPGKDAMGTHRAVLLSGPPGIGKTTSAHLVATLNGYTPIEVNASDARNKKLLEVSALSNRYVRVLTELRMNLSRTQRTSRTGLLMDG